MVAKSAIQQLRRKRSKRSNACFSDSSQVIEKMERETGFEPATSSLGSWHSTTELLPRSCFLRVVYFQELNHLVVDIRDDSFNSYHSRR